MRTVRCPQICAHGGCVAPATNGFDAALRLPWNARPREETARWYCARHADEGRAWLKSFPATLDGRPTSPVDRGVEGSRLL